MSLNNKWVVITPGGTPCIYNNQGFPLYSKKRSTAIAKAVKDTSGMYASWAAMEKRGYTVELVKEAAK